MNTTHRNFVLPGFLGLAVTILGADAFHRILAQTKKPVTVAKTPAEYGRGLNKKSASAGWISLYDGKTTFGWKNARVKDRQLIGGESTSVFGESEIRVNVSRRGFLIVGNRTIKVGTGFGKVRITGQEPFSIRLEQSTAVSELLLRPLNLKAAWGGKDLSGWDVIRHPRLPENRQAKWSVKEGAIHAVGGPGALELPQRFSDMVLQIDIKTLRPLANGGIFFRCIPKAFMQGYEAQIYNACHGGDPAKVARWCTGAIDDRQNARRLVSRDGDTLTMTVIAAGPHIATWVNGYQTTDWTDTRKPHDNPRQGLRIKAGTIQLQAHDPKTIVTFCNFRVAEIK